MANHPWENLSTLSDLEISIGNQKIKCHKIMLAHRSPVFQKMFDINMKENLENKLTIEGIEEPTFLDFLHYLYEPEHDIEVSKLTIDLFRVGIRYLVPSLIEVFHKKFAEVIKKENAIEFAVSLFETDINPEFLMKTMDYIFTNFRNIKTCLNYMELISIPELAATLFDKFAGKNTSRYCCNCGRYY